MSLTSLKALQGMSTIINVSTSSNITLRRLTSPGATFRTVEVEYEDVPGSTVIQAVKATEALTFEVHSLGSSFGASLTSLQAVTDALCDPDLRTWTCELTYSSGRVEQWTALRPADCTSRSHDLLTTKMVVVTFSVPVHPVPTITGA